MRARRIVQLVLLAGSVAVVAHAVIGSASAATGREDRPCPEIEPVHEEDFAHVTPSPSPAPSPGRVLDAVLTPEAPEGIVMQFGKDRGPLHRKFFLALPDRSKATLPPVGSPLRVRQRPLVREEIDNVIDDTEYVASALFTGPREVTVAICVDPQVDPGTYKGILTLEHPQIRPVIVPVEVSLQFSHWVILSVFAAVTVLGTAPAYVWASRRKAAAEGGHVLISWAGIRELGAWILANFVAFAIACIAATSAFLANYWYDPSWGAEAPKDWFTLIGAVFTAFTTGMLTGTAGPRGGQTIAAPEEGDRAAAGVLPEHEVEPEPRPKPKKPKPKKPEPKKPEPKKP
jgi:hypothetical protein